MMSHPAMSLGDRFCDSRKGGTGGGGVLGVLTHNGKVNLPRVQLILTGTCHDDIGL